MAFFTEFTQTWRFVEWLVVKSHFFLHKSYAIVSFSFKFEFILHKDLSVFLTFLYVETHQNVHI